MQIQISIAPQAYPKSFFPPRLHRGDPARPLPPPRLSFFTAAPCYPTQSPTARPKRRSIASSTACSTACNGAPACSTWGSTAGDRKSTRLNSSHLVISYAVFCLKKKTIIQHEDFVSMYIYFD